MVNTTLNLNATVIYTVYTFNYIDSIIGLVAGIMIGLLLLYLHLHLRVPLLPISRTGKKFGDSLPWKKLLMVLLLLAGVLVVFWDFVENYSIESKAQKPRASFLCSDRSVDYSELLLVDGQEYSQTIELEEDHFCALGLWLSQKKSGYDGKGGTGFASNDDETSSVDEELMPDETDAADIKDNLENEEIRTTESNSQDPALDKISSEGTLTISVYDELGELIIKKTIPVKKLKRFSELKEPKDMTADEKKLLKQYKYFDLGKEIKNSANGRYRIALRADDTDNTLSIRTFMGEMEPAQSEAEPCHGTMCLISLYAANKYLEYVFLAISLMSSILVLAVFILCSKKLVGAVGVYLAGAILFGLIFSILIPPYCVPDERAHIDSVYKLSNELLGIKEDIGPGRIYIRKSDLEPEMDNTMPVSTDMYDELFMDLFKPAEDSDLIPTYARDASGNVTKLHYYPAAAGFSIARRLGLNRITMIMFGRWLNLLVVTLVFAMGIYQMPFGKAGLAVTGLLPMMLQQMASCSYDGLILASAALFIGSSLNILHREKQNLLSWFLMICSGAIIAMSKGGVYLPLTGIILLYPFYLKMWGKKERILISFGTLFIMIYLFASRYVERLASLFGRSLGSVYRVSSSGTSKELYTVGSFLDNPRKLIRLIQKTIYINGDAYLSEMLGSRLGMLRIWIPWMILLLIGIILYISTQKRDGDRDGCKTGERIWLLFLTVIGIVLTMVSMLLSWTTKGMTVIEGLQGRYFLPFLLLLIPVMRGNRLERKTSSDTVILTSAVMLVGIVVGFIICNTL